MTKNKSLDSILSKIEAYQWEEDNEPTIDATTVFHAKEEILQSLLSLIPERKMITKYNPDKHITEDSHKHSMSTRIGYNEALRDARNALSEWVNKV